MTVCQWCNFVSCSSFFTIYKYLSFIAETCWESDYQNYAMWKKFRELLKYITEFGVEDPLKFGTVKSIKMINQLSMVSALACLVFVFQGFDLKPSNVRIAEFFCLFTFITIPFISRTGHFVLARFIYYLVLNAYCFVTTSALGLSSGYHLFFIPILAATALVTNFRRKKYIVQALTIPMVPIFLLLYNNDSLAIDQQLYRQELEVMYRQNFFVSVVFSFLVAYFYYRITYQQQVMLRELLAKQSELNVTLSSHKQQLQQNLVYSDGLAERLKSSKDYYKSLLQNASDITSVVDAEGYFKYITPSFFRFTGFRPEDIINKTIFDFVYPEDAEIVQNRFPLILSNSPRSELFRFRFRTAEGGFLYLEARGNNLLEDENVGGVVINARNVTDRLYYEQEAITKEKNIRSILDNNDSRIWLVDKEFRLIDFNTAYAKAIFQLFGIKTKRDANLMELLPEAEQQKWQARYKQVFAGMGKTYTDTYQVAGEERSYLISLFPIQEGGRVDRVTAFAKDITEQESARKGLVEAKEKAEEATRAKAQFLSTMSHELRTPMNVVIGMTHLLMEDDVKPEQLEKLRVLKFSAESLLMLINDILDLSKIEAGKVNFERVSFNPGQLLSDIKDSMLQEAGKKGIELELQLGAGLPGLLLGDPMRLSQVLTNLLSNAIKFTDKGCVTLKLSQLRDAAGVCLLEFSVQDTGIGIPAHMQQAIFESFTQGSSDTSRRFGGTGLGLSISKRLLELQGSKIMLDSQEGKGSEFSFRLQFDKVDQLAGNTLNNKITVQNKGENKGLKGRKILMVEDNPLNVFLGVKLLQKWGVEVQSAESGKEALRLLQEQAFDMVLMDLQMPEMDGFEATRLIRALADPRIASLPVLAITAASEQGVKEMALEAGMNDFILKPFNPEELFETLSQYLQENPPNAVKA
jgi:PAS domain S-box-containing protein